MKIDRLEWDFINESHLLSKHRIGRKEVEDICFGFYLSRKQFGERYKLWGQTEPGRFLIIIVEKTKGTKYRPITAFDMAEKDRRYYKKNAKK
jgi:hypothetical protein